MKFLQILSVLSLTTFLSLTLASNVLASGPTQEPQAVVVQGGEAQAEVKIVKEEVASEESGGHHFVELVIFIGMFLIGTAFLMELTKKIDFPYTVALLTLGLMTQYLFRYFHIPLHVELSSDFIFFILLPALLFGAAMHVNIHQFRIQFKTISFAATFGLLVSVFVIGALLPYLVGLPLGPSLLFGAMISATDPIAVLALFKTLGAPNRLALVADGESMFNDATGVIAFRIVSAVVVGGTVFGGDTLFKTIGDFSYVFFGSLIVGSLVGYVLSEVLARIKNDILIETTLALGVALLSFAGAEHFFHLSGVITSVMAGLIAGNLGRSRISANVIHFMHEFWDYLGHLAVSAVFFFATFSLDLGIFANNPVRWMITVAVVLVARAVSVYLGYALSNVLPFFKDEPNVPLSWQHILNWGGLRGVIPLVLVFTIPDTYAYKEDLFVFTFATLLFTLFVNGLTVSALLKKLGLHLPAREEQIHHEEEKIFALEHAKNILAELPKDEFSKAQIGAMAKKLDQQESEHRAHLKEIASKKELEKSLMLQAIQLEKSETEKLFHQGYISESVMYDFDAQLDLQLDAIEYPETYTRGVSKKGKVASRESFRRRIMRVRELGKRLPFLQHLWDVSEDMLVLNRYSLLKARMITSEAVLNHLDRVQKLFPKDKDLKKAILAVEKVQQSYVERNKKEIVGIEKKYRGIVDQYQTKLLNHMIEPHLAHASSH